MPRIRELLLSLHESTVNTSAELIALAYATRPLPAVRQEDKARASPSVVESSRADMAFGSGAASRAGCLSRRVPCPLLLCLLAVHRAAGWCSD